MPLQLMIAVIVAGLTLAVALGWVLSIQTPAVIKTVGTDPTTVYVGDVPEDRSAVRTVPLLVTAYDASHAPIPDIVVTARGAVARTVVAHDADDGSADGTASFSALAVQLPPGVHLGEITLTIHKAGYPAKTWSVPVVRGA